MMYTSYAIMDKDRNFLRHWHAEKKPACDLCAKGVQLDAEPNVNWQDDAEYRVMLSKWVERAAEQPASV